MTEDEVRSIRNEMVDIHDRMIKRGGLPPSFPRPPEPIKTSCEETYEPPSMIDSMLARLAVWIWTIPITLLVLVIAPIIFDKLFYSSEPPIRFLKDSQGHFLTRLITPVVAQGDDVFYEVHAKKRTDCLRPDGRVELEFRAWKTDSKPGISEWYSFDQKRMRPLHPEDVYVGSALVPPHIPCNKTYDFQWRGEYYCAKNAPDMQPWVVDGPKMKLTILCTKTVQTVPVPSKKVPSR